MSARCMLGAHGAGLIALFSVGTGCYMPQEGELNSTADGLEASEGQDEGGAYSGPLDGGRGILSSEGFRLYWQHYSTWEGGACTQLRLQNESEPVRGWQMILHTSDDMTYWADDGGAFFFPDGDMIWVESEGGGSLDRYDSVELYYCAEPAADILGLEVSWREAGHEGDRDEGDRDEGDREEDDREEDDRDDDPADLRGTMDYSDGSGNSLRLSYASWISASLSCLDLDIENTGRRPVVIEQLTLDFDGDFRLRLHGGAEVRQEQPDELTLVFSGDRESDPGDSIEARVCLEPLARPQRIEEVVITPVP